jgi:hypothetical protein
MLLVVLGLLGWLIESRATSALLDFCGLEADCRPAAEAELGRVRGGFITDTRTGRLEVSIGITRAVSVNDRLVAVSHIVLPDIAQIIATARSAAGRALAQNAALAALNGGAAAQNAALAGFGGGAAAPSAGAAPPPPPQVQAAPPVQAVAPVQAVPPAQLVINDVPSTASAPVTLPESGAILIQNGPGNIAMPATSFSANAVPTVVQNTLNDQVLRTVTLVQASVNSLSALNALALGDMLRRATAASGR